MRRERSDSDREREGAPKRLDTGRKDDMRSPGIGRAMDGWRQEWRCVCGMTNFAERPFCRSCNGPRTEDMVAPPPGVTLAGGGSSGNLALRTSGGAGPAIGLGGAHSDEQQPQTQQQWKCPVDNILNYLERSTCRHCGGRKPDNPIVVTTTQRPVSTSGSHLISPQGSVGEWRCSCGASNFADRYSCRYCKKPAPPGVGGQPPVAASSSMLPVPNAGALTGSGGIAPSVASGGPGGAPRDTSNDWLCRTCGFMNFPQRTACRQCTTPRPPGVHGSPGIRSGMRSGSSVGGWSHEGPGPAGGMVGVHSNVPHAAPSPQVADAAEEIERVDKQLQEIDNDISQLKVRKAHEVGKQRGSADPTLLVEALYKENLVKATAVHTWLASQMYDTKFPEPSQPGVPPAVPAPHPVGFADLEICKETQRKFEVHGAAIKAAIRRRKMMVYHRMRMTGERLAKEVESMEIEKAEGDGKAPEIVLPGGLYRLHHDMETMNERWDNSLAPEVTMEWNKDPYKYVFDDQTQRVLDPEAENRERRAMLRWTDEEQEAFVDAYREFGKDFHVIATKKPFRVSEVAPKSVHEIIAFYYHIKHRIGLKRLASKRPMMQRSNLPRELVSLGLTTEEQIFKYLQSQAQGQAAAAAAAAAAATGSAAVKAEVKQESIKSESVKSESEADRKSRASSPRRPSLVASSSAAVSSVGHAGDGAGAEPAHKVAKVEQDDGEEKQKPDGRALLAETMDSNFLVQDASAAVLNAADEVVLVKNEEEK